MSQPQLDENVRRTVGLATLRRLQRMVAAERAHETERARWAARLAWGFGVAAVVVLAWLAFR